MSFQKNATQSTEAWPLDLYKSGNAVDRDVSTCMRTQPIGPTSPYKTVWWKVDLGGVYNIYSVNILFKSYDEYGKEKTSQISFMYSCVLTLCMVVNKNISSIITTV